MKGTLGFPLLRDEGRYYGALVYRNRFQLAPKFGSPGRIIAFRS
jgi:hypothetical protein